MGTDRHDDCGDRRDRYGSVEHHCYRHSRHTSWHRTKRSSQNSGASLLQKWQVTSSSAQTDVVVTGLWGFTEISGYCATDQRYRHDCGSSVLWQQTRLLCHRPTGSSHDNDCGSSLLWQQTRQLSHRPKGSSWLWVFAVMATSQVTLPQTNAIVTW